MGDAIQKTSYSHEAMADCILANPRISQKQIAEYFGYTQAWISQILSSDSFRSYFAERKKELHDPIVTASIDDMMNGVLRQSLGLVQDQLEKEIGSGKTALAVKMIEIGQRAAGYGARSAQVQVNNYVAMIPAKAANATDWLQDMGRPVHTITIDQNVIIPDDTEE